MTLVCAWCGANVQRSGYNLPLDSETSHGLCSSCARAFVSQDGTLMQQYINTISVPILLVDNNTGVVAGNTKACEMLGWTPNNIVDQLFGPVFDCAHSRLPQGCGRTIHCSGCALRNTVAQTFETGEPQICIPATLTVEHADSLSQVVLSITTVKVDGLVILRLDQVKKCAF